MKAAIVRGKGKIEVEEIPKPQPGPGMLLLKVLYCSICGSDVEKLYSPNWDTAPEVMKAIHVNSILGHEYVGRVEEMGSGVTGWKVGERAVDLHTACGKCFYCLRGMSDLCMQGRVRGHPYDGTPSPIPGPARWGAFTEYVLRPAISRLKVPDNIPDQEAAMIEPLATGVTGVLAGGVKIGDSVVVIGVGHIGAMVLAAAKAAGAAPLIAVDLQQERLEAAKKVGANIVINASKTDPIKEVVAITEAGADIVIIAVAGNAPGVLEQAFEMVRYHGRVIIIGNSAPATLPTGKWMTKEVRIEGAVHVGESMIPSLALLQYGRVNIKPVLTEVVPLAEIQRGFESLRMGKNIAVLIKP